MHPTMGRFGLSPFLSHPQARPPVLQDEGHYSSCSATVGRHRERVLQQRRPRRGCGKWVGRRARRARQLQRRFAAGLAT